MAALTDYEKEREERIARNKALLASLNIPKAIKNIAKRAPSSSKPVSERKRKRNASPLHELTNGSVEIPQLTRRRSVRLQKMPRRQYEDNDQADSKSDAYSDYSSIGSSEDELDHESSRMSNGAVRSTAHGLSRRTVNGRNVAHIDKSFDRPNPKVFGDIPGISTGHWWATRMEASRDGCHAPTVAGISGNEREGCWSIALSGGYEDDVDEGYCFTYTGSGGRDLKGTKSNPKNLRTAPQSADQTLTGLNLALKVSCDTGKPVRVIRGFKGHSKWSPSRGYRYDGLYKVVKHWEEVGLAGFLVMKYAFVRLENQDDIRVDIPDEDDI